MAEQARKSNDALKDAERLCSIGDNLEIWRVPHFSIREQQLNARVMPPEMFDRLTQNIRKDNRVESLPFGVMREKHIELISGHHRLRAAVAAGLIEIPIIVDTRDLSKSSVKAKQLAHNSIIGTDDEDILARIFSQIDSVEDRFESFVNIDDGLKDAIDGAVKTLNEEVDIEWPVLSITFLPKQMERLLEIEERLAKQVPKDTDLVWIVPEEIAERFTTTLNNLSVTCDIRTVGNIFARMTEIVQKALDNGELDEQKSDSETDS